MRSCMGYKCGLSQNNKILHNSLHDMKIIISLLHILIFLLAITIHVMMKKFTKNFQKLPMNRFHS